MERSGRRYVRQCAKHIAATIAYFRLIAVLSESGPRLGGAAAAGHLCRFPALRAAPAAEENKRMAQRRIPVTHPKKTITYFAPPESDGWRVELTQGFRIVRREAVDTKEEAIERTRALIAQYPGTTFETCVLSEGWAWQTEEGWQFGEWREGALPAKLLDEFGERVLMVQGTGAVEFVRGWAP